MKPYLVPKELPRTPRDIHTPKGNTTQNDSFRSFSPGLESMLNSNIIKKLGKGSDIPSLTDRALTREPSSSFAAAHKANATLTSLPKIPQVFKLDSNTKYFIQQSWEHRPKVDKYVTVNESAPAKTSAFTFRPLTKNFKYLFPGASHTRSSEKLILGPIVLSPTSPKGNKIRQLSVKDFMSASPMQKQGSMNVRFREPDTHSTVAQDAYDIHPPMHTDRPKIDVMPSPRRSYMKKATLIRPKIKLRKNKVQSESSLDEPSSARLEMILEDGTDGSRTHGYPTENDLE